MVVVYTKSVILITAVTLSVIQIPKCAMLFWCQIVVFESLKRWATVDRMVALLFFSKIAYRPN